MKSVASARSWAVVQLTFYLVVVLVLGVNECHFNSECSGTEECACKEYTRYRRGRNGATYREVAYRYCCSPTYYYGLGGTAAIIVIIAIIGIVVGCYCYKRNCGKRSRIGRVAPLTTSVNSSEINNTHQLQLQSNSDNIVHVPPAYTAFPAPGHRSAAVPFSGAPASPYAAYPAIPTGSSADGLHAASLPP